MGFDYSLSPSKLSKFKECPRCFWDLCKSKLEYRGIFPSLPGGLDRVLKEHYDSYREIGALPPELIGQLPGGTILYGTKSEMMKMRHWKSNPHKPTIQTKAGVVSLIMAYDDLLIDQSGMISNLDAKSKGDRPKDDGSKYYQIQLDVYYLAGLLAGWKMSGVGYLAYYYPQAYMGAEGLRMGCDVYGLKCDRDRILDLIERAAACLAGGQPPHNPDCELCTFAQVRVDAERATMLFGQCADKGMVTHGK